MNKTTFSAKELNNDLIALGFTKSIASAIAQECFPFELINGNSRLYEIPKEPIHRSVLEKLYSRQRGYWKKKTNSSSSNSLPKNSNSVNEAWETLVEAGVIKPKFNLKLLKSKYPKIYLECMEYEIVK